MLGFPIVDTHLHLWDPGNISYPWIADIAILNRPYLLPDYVRTCGPHEVERMVFLQCEADYSQYKEEADWVSALAQDDPRIEGMVPWAPLEKGEEARDALAELAENKLVKGIRRIIQFEADPAWCLQSGYVAGVRLLPEFGLHCEICIKGADQTANTIELIKRCPEVTFILDHVGKPYIDKGELEPWKTHIAQLAALPHVWCKMSGLVVEADMPNWTPEDLRPYVRHVLESFGFDRVMFGGDWPVVVQAAELHRWIDTLDQLTADDSDAERRKLFHDNAIAFYRLA